MNNHGCIYPNLVKDPCGEFEVSHLEMNSKYYLRKDDWAIILILNWMTSIVLTTEMHLNIRL